MSRVAIVSTCAMKQRAMDFAGNLERIVESVRKAKEMGSRYRSGPELEITGYGCGDHFLEADTERHAWEAVAQLLQHEVCSSGIMVDVGLPVQHNNVVYNCRLVFLNRKVLLIRPKMIQADDSHMSYQETRWFTNWQKVRQTEDYQLPPCITKVTGQRSVPFGDALLQTRDTTIGIEICEECWNPASPHVGMYLAGAEIICNGSGSLQEVGNPDSVWSMIKNETGRSGGCYLLANEKGSDGSLGYYAGESGIAANGKLLSVAPLHTLSEVDVVTAVVDLDDVLTYKNQFRSRSRCAAAAPAYPRVQVDFTLCQEENDEGREGKDKPKGGHVRRPLTLPIEPSLPTVAEQVLEGTACWLWDFLCRSQRHGLLLQLCGEVSDTATAAIVFTMCHKVMETVPLDAQVKANLLRVTGGTLPKNVHELCGRLLVTFSGKLSVDNRAAAIAQQIGSEHITPEMEGDAVLEAVRSAKEVAVTAGGGQYVPTQALPHLHAFRARLLALRAAQGEVGRGGARQLLVLATTPGGDMPEAIRGTRPLSDGGHFGDVSVVGYIPKGILREVLLLAKERYNLPVLGNVLTEVTEKQDKEKTKEDKKKVVVMEEEDWAEMWTLNRTQHLGPRAMFLSLMHRWKCTHSPAQVARCVQTFFTAQGARGFIPPGAPSCYVVCLGSQHPARPLLTPEALTWQFKAINDEVKKLECEGH